MRSEDFKLLKQSFIRRIEEFLKKFHDDLQPVSSEVSSSPRSRLRLRLPGSRRKNNSVNNGTLTKKQFNYISEQLNFLRENIDKTDGVEGLKGLKGQVSGTKTFLTKDYSDFIVDDSVFMLLDQFSTEITDAYDLDTIDLPEEARLEFAQVRKMPRDKKRGIVDSPSLYMLGALTSDRFVGMVSSQSSLRLQKGPYLLECSSTKVLKDFQRNNDNGRARYFINKKPFLEKYQSTSDLIEQFVDYGIPNEFAEHLSNYFHAEAYVYEMNQIKLKLDEHNIIVASSNLEERFEFEFNAQDESLKIQFKQVIRNMISTDTQDYPFANDFKITATLTLRLNEQGEVTPEFIHYRYEGIDQLPDEMQELIKKSIDEDGHWIDEEEVLLSEPRCLDASPLPPLHIPSPLSRRS